MGQVHVGSVWWWCPLLLLCANLGLNLSPHLELQELEVSAGAAIQHFEVLKVAAVNLILFVSLLVCAVMVHVNL